MTTDAEDTPERWATTVVESNGADLLRYFARRAAEEALDLLNETLAVVWEQRARLPRDPVDARMWSFGVARNMLRRHQRHRTRQTRLVERLRLEGEVVTKHTTDPAQTTEENEREGEVRAAISALRPIEREMVVLVHWDGFTIADAAELLGLNPSTARTRYGRAKRRLAAYLAQHSLRHASDVRPLRPRATS